jgi:hypothetical protein
MGLKLTNTFYLRDSKQREIIPLGREENLLLASCCAEQGHAREMISYLAKAEEKKGIDMFLLESILGTYKKSGWKRELAQVKNTKANQFHEEEANYVLSLLTPEKYKEAIMDFAFGWFFDPFGYINPEASELSLNSGSTHFSAPIIRMMKR